MFQSLTSGPAPRSCDDLAQPSRSNSLCCHHEWKKAKRADKNQATRRRDGRKRMHTGSCVEKDTSRPRRPRIHTPRANPSMRSLRTHTRKRLQGCLPNPPDTEHAVTHPSLSTRVPACVRRLRPAHRKTIRPKSIPGSPSQPHRNSRENEENHGMCHVFRTAAAAALAQEKALTRTQTCPPCPPTAKTYSQGAMFEGFERCWGCKGCWNAQMLVMQERRRCWQSF